MKPRLTAFSQIASGDDVVQVAIRIGLLALLLYWSFILIRPFIPILVWGIVLAVALYPCFAWLSRNLGERPRLAAVMITLLNLAIVIGPVAWLGVALVGDLKTISDHLGAGNFVLPSPPQGIKDWPLVGEKIYDLWSLASTNLEAVFKQLAPHLKPLAGVVLGFAGSAGVGTLKFVAAVALAGYLFLAGPRLVTASRNILARIVPQQGESFVGLAGATIRTISQGVIGIAVVQSLFLGIGFKLLGVPGAGVLTIIAMILGILQIGSALVVFPVVIWIWMSKDFTIALLATIYLLVVGLADNAAKPILMGRSLTTPMLVILIGLLGGTIAHGIIGLFVGPIILGVAWELMMAWIRDEQVSPALPETGTVAEN